ncbi:DNA polymerase [Pseudaquabacterium rugosum]|uniref:DNA polymerase n=1 Tax=Pseudaquabacterium rugosum TaxID=2984194 RepID=A0ABU9B7R2_9BURK
MVKVLLFQKDYTDRLFDRYFILADGTLRETHPTELAKDDAHFICHDYWLIARSLFRSAGALPQSVLDLEDYRVSTCGFRDERRRREQVDISRSLAGIGPRQDVLKRYVAIFNRTEPLDLAVYEEVGSAMLAHWQTLEAAAIRTGEAARYSKLEQPVSKYLIESAVEGIAIDQVRLRQHKKNIEHEYYMALKQFSTKYSLPIEVPSDEDVIEYLTPLGFDFTDVNVDYVIEFVPSEFGADLKSLKKLANSRQLLSAIPFSQQRIHPIVDCFGSVTSRIYFKDPSLQNLAKRHRDIVCADAGKVLSYVDYDQYEVGIMAALSEDPVLLALYSEGDLYQKVSESLFCSATMRKQAKRLFLSYAYGMNFKSLIDAAVAFGAQRSAARAFFRSFSIFENWKLQVCQKFKDEGRIGTSFGNYLNRVRDGDLSPSEKRSAVSQVVQGTASLIFKKALLRLSDDSALELKIPMHDAALVQHSPEYDSKNLVRAFSEVMSEHFSHRIVGKASLDLYAPPAV